MSLDVTNLLDGVTLTVPDGGIGMVTVQAGGPSGTRSFFIKSDTADWLQQYIVADSGLSIASLNRTEESNFNISGDFSNNAGVYSPIYQGDYATPGLADGTYYFQHVTPAGFLTLTGLTPGTYYVGIVLTQLDVVNKCGLLVRVLPEANLPMYPALAWVPSNLIDLQLDLNAGTANSAILSHRAGLKQGDDFTLAVIPYLPAGTLVTAGITAMSLSILNEPGSDDDPIVFAATGGPPTLTEVGGDATHQYYSIVGNLRDQLIQGWFDDLNDAVDAANAAAPSQPPTPHPGRIEAIAWLSITTAAGITTTESFPFPILQST